MTRDWEKNNRPLSDWSKERFQNLELNKENFE